MARSTDWERIAIEKIVILTDPRSRGHIVPKGAARRSIRFGQEAEGAGENVGRGLYCGFHGTE